MTVATVNTFDAPVSGGSSSTIDMSGIALGTHRRVLWALLVHEVKRRYIRRPMNLLFEIGQPLMFMIVMRSGLMFLRGVEHTHVLGGYSVIFLATGMLPVYAFKRSLTGAKQCFATQKKLLFLRVVTPIDLFFIGAVIDTVFWILLMLGLTVAFMLIYQMQAPKDLPMALLPFIINGFIGFGFAMFNTCVELKYPVYGNLFSMVTGPLNIISGMFWTASTMPKMSWAYLYWNPFLHSTEWVREGYFYNFESGFLDVYFYLFFCLIVLALGFGAERIYRRQLMAQAL